MNTNLSIILHVKLHIVHIYRILASQTINIFYHTYILLYYQNPKFTFMIILLLVKINKIILDFALQRFVANIATRYYRTSQLTPQADQEPGQY